MAGTKGRWRPATVTLVRKASKLCDGVKLSPVPRSGGIEGPNCANKIDKVACVAPGALGTCSSICSGAR